MAAEAVEQLDDLMEVVTRLTDRTAVQVRNAFMSDLLRGSSAITPATMNAKWDESDTRAGIERAQTLAKALDAAVQTL